MQVISREAFLMGASNLKNQFPHVLGNAYAQYKRDLLRLNQVNDIMSHDVVTINPEATLQEAAVLMGEKHIGSLIVRRNRILLGIITERDLLTKILACGKSPATEKVEENMACPLITIDPEAKIKEAAQKMYRNKSRLVVLDKGELVGIVTASDLIRSMPEVPETQVQVDDFMTRTVVTADENTPVTRISKIMGEEHIGSVVITRKGRPFAIFTERDLLTKILAKNKPVDIPVGEVASSPLITIPAGTSVHNAAATMAIKHIRRLPVAAPDEILVGVITSRDLIEAYAR
jgi:CBS domain-containing protein